MENLDGCQDFESLRKNHPNLAKSLLNEVEEGKWQSENLYLYPKLEEFTTYELIEGVYADFNLNNEKSNYLPNIIDFIDLKSLGQALVNTSDPTCTFSNGEVVITTSYGCVGK